MYNICTWPLKLLSLEIDSNGYFVGGNRHCPSWSFGSPNGSKTLSLGESHPDPIFPLFHSSFHAVVKSG